MMKKAILLILVCLGLSLKDAVSQTQVKIDPSIRYQEMKGWGASLCWWANKAGGFTDTKVDEICRWITSPDELNMNVFRYNIGGGDNPSHNHLRADGGAVPGFKASVTASYDWSQDARQRKILLKLNSLRKDVINEAFSNSPPYWMTKSSCVSGNTDGSDNLKDDQYTAFADYLTEVVRYYKDQQNITFHSLDPFNEPFSGWWKANGGQEGCKFNQGNQQKMILELYAKMSQKKILDYCRISAMDANSIDEAVNGINGYDAAGNILSKIGQINAHSYSGSKRQEFYLLGKKHGKEVWQSETGPLSVNASGLDNHLVVAQRILTDLRDMKPVVWCDWQLMTDQDPVWGLIPANYSNQTYYKAKSYYVRMQCSRFIKQGYTIIESNNGNTVAAINPEGTELVIVVCNTNAIGQDFAFDLSTFNTIGTPTMYRTSANENCVKSTGPGVSNKKLIHSSLSKSITTFVIPVSLKSPLSGVFQIIARHSNKALQAESASSAAAIVQATSSQSSNQLWDVIPVGPFYKIINKSTGFALDVNQSSLDNLATIIQYPYNGDDNQLWSLVDLGNGYYELLNKFSLKAVDILNSSITDGGGAIQYAFGNYTNQQFLLKSIITGLEENPELENTAFCFPNPFDIHCLIKSKFPFKFSLTDVYGKTMQSGSCIGECEIGKNLSSGLYTLLIKQENGKVLKYLKIVKN